MKYKYAIIGLDVDQKHLEEILNVLEKGYVIISSQSTRNHVHYVLALNEVDEEDYDLSDFLEIEEKSLYEGGSNE